MMSASFGRELADSHFRQLLEEHEHDRLVGSLKRQRRESRERAAVAARHSKPMPAACAQDIG